MFSSISSLQSWDFRVPASALHASTSAGGSARSSADVGDARLYALCVRRPPAIRTYSMTGERGTSVPHVQATGTENVQDKVSDWELPTAVLYDSSMRP